MSLKNKSILVAGGAGFIGSHLVDSILAMDVEKVIVIDNLSIGKERNLETAKKYSNFKFFKEDATNFDKTQQILKDEGVEVVFNLAALPLPASLINPLWVFDENITITKNLCEMAREDIFKTLMQFSTSEVYGTTIYNPMNEEHPLNPHTPYAASKAACDHLAHSYYKTFGIDISIIRPFNNYGPRQNEGNYAAIIPLTIKKLLKGENPIIYGDGLQTRDFVYVQDDVNAILSIYNCKATRGKSINIASGREIVIKELIEVIMKHLGIYKEIVYEEPRKGDVRRLIGDITTLKNLTGFEPKMSFEEGIKKTIDWYKKNIEK